mmetsp:Transcript_16718/g.41406  ORF Transcript_16718/g.41406 Transcript_16718/m.41406 type:complete len:205 (-) Transcript_16718:157-771(-)
MGKAHTIIRPSSLVPTVPAIFPFFLRYFSSYLAWLGERYGTSGGLPISMRSYRALTPPPRYSRASTPRKPHRSPSSSQPASAATVVITASGAFLPMRPSSSEGRSGSMAHASSIGASGSILSSLVSKSLITSYAHRSMSGRWAATAGVSSASVAAATVPMFLNWGTVPSCRAKTPAATASCDLSAHARRSSETVGSAFEGIMAK